MKWLPIREGAAITACLEHDLLRVMPAAYAAWAESVAGIAAGPMSIRASGQAREGDMRCLHHMHHIIIIIIIIIIHNMHMHHHMLHKGGVALLSPPPRCAAAPLGRLFLY